MSSPISASFHHLIADLRAQQGEASPEQISVWATQLMELQSALSQSTLDEVSQQLNVSERQVFALLGLGKDNRNSVDDYKVLLEIIANHPDQSAGLAVVEFLKSPEGFKLMNSPSQSLAALLQGKDGEGNRNVLEAFLGGAFGLQLSQKILKSIKAEEIGTLLTYALSGNFERDRMAFDANGGESALAFVLRKAKCADMEFVLDTTTTNSLQTVEGRVTANNRTTTNGVRGRLRPDHFVSNFATQRTFITNTTSNRDKSAQGDSFLKYYLAAARHSKTKFVNGRANPYYNHKVCASYLSSGLFPQDGDPEENSIARNFTKYVNRSELTQREKRDMGQIEFLGLLGNCSAPEHATILFAHNPIVAGCDTLDLYWTSLKVSDCIERNDTAYANELITTTVAKKFKSIADSAVKMLDSNVLAPTLDNGQYLDTNSNFAFLLGNLTRAVEKLPKVLDFTGQERLKNEMLDSLENLIAAADHSAVSSFGALIDQLSDRVEQLRNAPSAPPSPRHSLRTGLEYLCAHTSDYPSNIHSHEFQAVQKLSDVDFQQLGKDFFGACDQTPVHIKGKFKAAFEHYMLSLTAHPRFSDELLIANNAGNELWGASAKAAFGSVKTLRAAAGDFAKQLEQAGYPLMGEFVRKTRFLLGTDSAKGRIDVADLNQQKTNEFIDWVNALYTANAHDVSALYKRKI